MSLKLSNDTKFWFILQGKKRFKYDSEGETDDEEMAELKANKYKLMLMEEKALEKKLTKERNKRKKKWVWIYEHLNDFALMIVTIVLMLVTDYSVILSENIT